MEKYDPKKIEKKWQEKWETEELYKTPNTSKKPKYYALDMFPYISGSGIHVGHPKGYIATDVVSRLKMLQGFNVLHPMGWDAFGLPAENYAIKHKLNPNVFVKEHIDRFRKQMKLFGFAYDWDREFSTTDSDYYRWTQWIFLKLFEKGLAYESEEPVNWCPKCKTVLANEDLEKGLCERCGTQVIQKRLRQWVLKMTDYADRLLYDLDSEELEWEELIKEQQRNWIGRSEGVEFEMQIKNSDEKIKVYTTRLDTVFGMTYAVVAPEHSVIEKLKDAVKNYEEIEKYIIKAQNKTELERTQLQKEKTGVELQGIKVINPFTKEEIPLYVADYVLGFYGTGAVMAVPAHDERDFEFAKKYNLPIKQAIAPYVLDEKNPPRKDSENTVRKVVHVLLENERGEILTLNLKGDEWGDNKPKTFIIGGMEDGETPEETALREIKEETGYTDVKVSKVHPIEFHAEFFAAHKNVNRYVKTIGVICRLNSEKQIPINEKEKKLHDIVWVKRELLSGIVTIPDDIFLSRAYIEDAYTYTDSGVLINSGAYDGLTSEEARDKIAKWLEKEKIGKEKVNYKMRDWVFSRQRYWGEPIPIIHCEKCGAVPVPEKDLPVMLPDVKNYEPTDTGESPLANIKEWVDVKCPKCGGEAKRETNTMPQWAGSCWYYLRFIDPKNTKVLIDKEKEKYWMPVDLYVGGAEHATRHLLYARFWHKFLFDIGVVFGKEPFKKLVHVGLINAEDGRKMSKRWGNVVNPDDVIFEFGVDSLRLYEMFMGPFSQTISWSTKGVSGMRRFLEKVYKLNSKIIEEEIEDNNLESFFHKTIKKVSEDIENFRFNTAISSLMILLNELEKEEKISITDYKLLITLVSPFTPHVSEELWEKLGHKESIFKEKWPEYDPALIKDEEIELVIQVNGKLRDRIKVAADISEDEAKKKAFESEKIKNFIGEKEIRKAIFVKGKLINIVI